MFFSSKFYYKSGETARGRKIYIETPHGKIVEVKHKDGTSSMELKWADDFSPRREKNFKKAQAYIDSECIRLMKKYTPMKNGILHKSATLGTQIGTGKIVQVAPYARYQYYGKLMVSSVTGSSYARKGEKKVLTNKNLNYQTFRHPEAGAFWFEVMKSKHKAAILRGSSKITQLGGL